jgi:C4-dicarboxylate transporter DctM subunit
MWTAFKAAWPAVVMPVIIVGGIWTGMFTPTEAASIAVVYGVLISMFLYRELTWRDLPEILLRSFQTSAVVMLVIGATGCLAWLITVEQVAVQLSEWVQSVAHHQWLFLLLLNISLFVVGIFIEPLPAMLLTTPLFLPLAQAFHVDLVHLGVVVTANLSIALYTPPVGGTLFVAASLAKVGIGAVTRHLIPLMTATFIVVLLVTYIPATTKIILWLFMK